MSTESIRVGGFVPFTSIDYPGELSAVVFCQGCPWRCGYCHNRHLQPARSSSQLDWVELLKQLERRRGWLDAVVFSGGEPTLQTELFAAMKAVRELGFKIGLHTAGCYPERLKRLLPLLSWVGLDIKDLPAHYAALTSVPHSGERAWRSLQLLRDSGVHFQVRTTVAQQLSRSRLHELQLRLAAYGVEDHVLQECR